MNRRVIPKGAMTVLGVDEQQLLAAAVRSALMTPTSDRERRKLDVMVKRARGEFLVQVVDIEADAILTELYLLARGRSKAAMERAILALFQAQLECVIESAGKVDATLAKLSPYREEVRELFTAYTMGSAAGYLKKLEERVGSL